MKKQRTASEFKKAVELYGIKRWHIHFCCLCGYDCGYRFIDGKVFYDNGCDCGWINPKPKLHERTWEDVAYQYNIQDDEKVIATMDKFFGFGINK